MSTTEIIKEIRTLPREKRKALLKLLFEEAEEEFDAQLFDERSPEPDGRTLEEVVSEKKNRP